MSTIADILASVLNCACKITPPHYVIKGILVSYNKKGDFVAQLSACATLLGSTR